jgi:hypothetical protein
MPFRPQDLHDLDVAREIKIETRDDRDVVRATIIWIVVDKNELFVRSVRGERGRWYRDALATPEVTINDNGRRLEVRAIPVRDADSVRRINEALKRKYAKDDGYDEMLVPEVLTANFRLEPRFADEGTLEAPAYLGADEPSELGPPVEISPLDAGPAIEENVILQPHKSA